MLRKRPSSSQRVANLSASTLTAGNRRFCGRDRELGFFRDALAGTSSPVSVLYVYGLGGVGKSALVDACASEASRNGIATVRLDARHIEPTPRGFQGALDDALGPGDVDSARGRLREEEALVLAIDSYDALAPLDSWIRENFLRLLPERAVVMMAGREPPSVDWIADPSVPLFRALPLRNLSPAESRRLLSDRRVPAQHHDAVVNFTHGHPLALVLVADVLANSDSDEPFTPEAAPNVVHALLTRLIASVPTARHRKALEMCAQVRVTTEPLLAVAVNDGDSHELFEWLRNLSFMEQSAGGLFPHDLAREVLDIDFRWRDPDGYQEMHRRVWRYLRQKLLSSTGHARQRVFFDKIYLHRVSPTGSRYHDYTTLGTIYSQTAAKAQHEAIIQNVRRWEGPESARLAEHWLGLQPQAFSVIHGPRDEMLGFVASIVLPPEPTEPHVDPAVRHAWAFVRGRGHLRTGEQIVHHRFHISCNDYQELSPNINLLAMCATFAPLEHRRLAWSFVTFARPDGWLPLMRYINFERADEAGFTVGDRHYAVFAHDWRVEPFELWWDQLCERSLVTEPTGDEVVGAPTSPVVVLSEPEFATYARQALRDFTRPAALASNPLVRSRLVADPDGNGAGAARLQTLLREALDSLHTSPKDAKFYRALLYTYVQPAATQEAAAERLGLPFSTYRYHLARGTQRLVEWLWDRELAGFGTP